MRIQESRPVPSGVVGVAAVFAALAAVFLWLNMLASPYRLARGLLEGSRHLSTAERMLSSGRVRAARFETLAAEAAADRARGAFSDPNPLIDVAAAIPPVGDALGEVDHIVRAMELSADAAVGTLTVADNALRGGLIARDPENPKGGSIIDMARIEKAAETITAVGDAARSVVDQLGMIQLDKLPARARSRVTRALRDAREAVTRIKNAEDGFAVLPTVLGADTKRTYLLGFQNPAEQRGTGGAILQFKVLELDNGRLTLEDIEGGKVPGSVYNLDQERRTYDIPLPENAWIVKEIEDAQRFGNSNWSPDWPLSARLMIRYARKSAQEIKELEVPELDGFIVVDPLAVKEMMAGVGPFRTARSHDRITPRNVVNFVLYEAYGKYPSPGRRRAVLAQIVDGFFNRALAPPRPEGLARGTGEALLKKNVQIWMKDPEIQKYIKHMNWDGGIERAKRSDYVFVVEQNVGGNKLDYFDVHANEVKVTIQGRDALASTEMRVRNGVFSPQPSWIMGDAGPVHQPMMNLYVPRRAELLSSDVDGERIDTPLPAVWTEGGPPEHLESGKKVWSATLRIPPQQEGSVRFDYRVPAVVRRVGNRNVYELVVQSQRKVNPEMLTIRLSLPEGAKGIRAEGWKHDGSTLVWQRMLKGDVALEVSWQE
ncbi:MAG: DUF4012 domain-containing protein [Actinomycetota bacterium]